jgi:hypothetical protein
VPFACCCRLQTTHRTPASTSSITAHSSAEPRAISNDRRRSPLVALPLPSALFSALACDARLRCAQALILRVTLSFHMLAVALGPADRLDGRTLYVELLMTEWHRAFSLSIPIPIPIPIVAPTPIALRRCLDSVVSVIHEPLLIHLWDYSQMDCRFGNPISLVLITDDGLVSAFCAKSAAGGSDRPASRLHGRNR